MSRRSIIADWLSPTIAKNVHGTVSDLSDVVVIYNDFEHRTSTSSYKTRKGWEFWQWKRHFLLAHWSVIPRTDDAICTQLRFSFFNFFEITAFSNISLHWQVGGIITQTIWSFIIIFSVLALIFFNIDKNDVLSEKEIDQSGFHTIANFSPSPPLQHYFFLNQVFFYIQNTNINNYTQKFQTYLLQLVK